jgi:hypothetical protein
MVGFILYSATITRPDIAFAAALLFSNRLQMEYGPRACSPPSATVCQFNARCCLTLDDTGGSRNILGYADADWGGCLDTCRSSIGYLFIVSDGPVAWKARRQPTAAFPQWRLNTWPPEVRMDKLLCLDSCPMILGLGNNCRQLCETITLRLSSSAEILVHHDRAKHIDIIYHHIRDDITYGQIDITYIPSAENFADLFTKSLSTDSHERHDLYKISASFAASDLAAAWMRGSLI